MALFLVGLTLDELRDLDAEHADDSLASVAAYGRPKNPRYAAIWHSSPGTKRKRLILGVRTLAEPIKASAFGPRGEFDPFQLSGPRLAPILVTATGDLRSQGELGVHTTWVFETYERDGRGGFPKDRGIVSEKLDDLLTTIRLQESNPVQSCHSLDVVWYTRETDDGKRKVVQRFLAIGREDTTPFDVFSASTSPLSRIRDTAFGVWGADIMRKARGSYMRLHAAVPAPKKKGDFRECVMHMRRDTFETWPGDLQQDFRCGAETDGPLRMSELQFIANARFAQDQIPLEVRANGVGGDVRFCVTWAKRVEPKKRYFRLWSGTDPAPPQVRLTRPPSPPPTFPEFDALTDSRLQDLRDALEARMREKHISNAQLAIAVNGRLKLLWSLTLGEAGWTMTQPTHKFRFASCAKTLTGMRAVSLGTSFLGRTLASALQVQRPPNLSGQASAAWDNFEAIRIEDCLRMTSGLTSKNNFDVTFKRTGEKLPLGPGFLTLALKNGAVPELAIFPPKEYESYSNFAFIAVGEAISYAVRDRTDRYLEAMRDWWPLQDLSLVRYVPRDREESFDLGEAPIRSTFALARDSFVKPSTVVDAGELEPEWVSGNAYAGPDMEFIGGTGGLTLSAATMVRLLQILHPQESPSPRQGVRLTADQLWALHDTQNGLVVRAERGTDDVPDDPTLFMPRYGRGVEPTFVWDPVNIQIQQDRFARLGASWKGDLWGMGRSIYWHFTYFPLDGQGFTSEPPSSMSIAVVTNCRERLEGGTDIDTVAQRIFRSGGWDNDVDLFPSLGLD